ncbi:MAG: hypothetical protein AB1921_12485 [Thermodesulfobacteriota bacterium]
MKSLPAFLRHLQIPVFCLLLIFTLAPAAVRADYTPETATRLVADVDARDPGTSGRLPLILIHGYSGTSEALLPLIDGTTADEKSGFGPMMDTIYDNGLASKFQIFRFHYVSNFITDSEIAQGLALRMEQMIAGGQMEDLQVVLVGHSNGGLVARAYMEEQTHTAGKYAGKLGGERVIRLITLGTPHHGSILANGDARQADPPDWQVASTFLNTAFAASAALTEPNRSDLRWDNYNSLPGYDAPGETNAWLAALNASSAYLGKIAAYYGSTEEADYQLKVLYDYLSTAPAAYSLNVMLVTLMSGTLPRFESLASPIYYGPYPDDRPFDAHIYQCFLSVAHRRFYSQPNDAYVSVDSGRGHGLAFLRTEFFSGFDHLQLLQDNSARPAVFAMLATDLSTAWDLREIEAPPVPPCFLRSLAEPLSAWSR